MIQVPLLLAWRENKAYQDSQVPMVILEYQDYLVKMEFQALKEDMAIKGYMVQKVRT